VEPVTGRASAEGWFDGAVLVRRGQDDVGAQPSRYAAAELYPAGRRGFAISMVMWARGPSCSADCSPWWSRRSSPRGTFEGHALTRTGALSLLGYGWNLCFVGGSGRQARDPPDAARTSVEGAVDAAVWSIAAVASLASTVVLSAAGYAALAWAACVLAVLPAALLLRSEAR
jgi:hypothetical protein